MWGWFGGAAAQKRKDSPKDAILTLRSQLDMLQKREKYLQTQMDEQDSLARKYVSTNKNAAKTALKRKKQYEHSMDQTVAQIGTLEQQMGAIESANINRETLEALSKAGDAMKHIHGKYTVEKVEETMYVMRFDGVGND
jgi:charged multivesicular body protein 4